MPIRHGGIALRRFDLAARPLLSKYDRATSIETKNAERIFANPDADRGDGRGRSVGHGDALFDDNRPISGSFAGGGGARLDHSISRRT
jgi:hypothetical protein